MYIAPYQLGEMDGLGKLRLKKIAKKIGRAGKKVVKKVGKVVKKVAPIVAIGAAAWFAGPAVIGLATKFGPAAAKLIASRAMSKRQQETGAPPESASDVNMQAYLNEAAAEYQRQQTGGGFVQASYGGGYAPSGASDYDGNGIAPTMPLQQEGAPLPQWVVPAAIAGVALLMLTQRR